MTDWFKRITAPEQTQIKCRSQRSGMCRSEVMFFFGCAVALYVLVARAQTATAPLWLAGGHAGKINAVSWSPDGMFIASGSDDATVKLWSMNGTLLRTFTTHPYQATAVAFSPDGTRLAIGTYAGGYRSGNNGLGRVLLWQATNGWAATNIVLLRSMTNRFGRITAVAFSPDGINLAAGNAAGSNIVRRVSDGAIVTSRAAYNTALGPAPVNSIAFASSGLFASGCDDGTIRVWNSSWAQLWNTNTAHTSNVTAVAFAPGGGILASAGLDKLVRVWSTTNWHCLLTLAGHTNGVTAVAFAPDGITLASGSEDGSIKLWDVHTGACIRTIQAHAGSVTALAFSPDNTQLLSGGEDATLKIWSAADGTLIRCSDTHTDYIKAVAISPDGTLCATAADDQTVQIRRLTDGKLLRTIQAHTGCVSAVCFSPTDMLLATGGGPLEPTVKLWDVTDGTLRCAIDATTNGVMALGFSPDGAVLATGGDYDEKVVRLWNSKTGELMLTLPGHSNGVTALAFSPGGDLLASAGRRFDQTVKVWAITNGALVRTFAGHVGNIETLAFSPDGDTIASGSSGTGALRVWKISDGSSRTFGTDTNTVFCVAFAADGSTLAAVSKDTIRLWDVPSGTLAHTITQETFMVSCLSYSPNGNLVLYGRQDSTLALSVNVPGALPQVPLLFDAIAADAVGTAAIEAVAQPMTRYVIQDSSNLFDWQFITCILSRSNRIQVTDRSTNGVPAKFYRGITPP